MWSLHSFYSSTNFCLIYLVSALKFAKVALASVATLLLTTIYCKYRKPLSRVSSYSCSFTSLCKSHLQNWQQEVYRRQDLLFESHWKNELWKQRHTNYTGPASFPTLQNPFIRLMPEDTCQCASRKLRVRVERKREHRAALSGAGKAAAKRKWGAAWRLALEEIFHLGHSSKLVYGFPGKLGLKFSFWLTDRGSLEL